MITNNGKDIVAKYLLGQVPAYASYLAIGCGRKPLATGTAMGDYSAQSALEFEMLRTPITSRGYVVEDGAQKIVFTAELPTQERYEISEIGVYSARNNPSASNFDSRILYSFSQAEGWEHHLPTVATALPVNYEPLDQGNGDNNISGQPAAFFSNANNKIFTNTSRISRYERTRFLDNFLAIAGNDSDMSFTNDRLVFNSGNHVHLAGTSLNLDKNSATDEMKVAFSVINRDGSGTFSSLVPDSVRLLVEFVSSESGGTAESAKFEINIDNGTSTGQQDFSTNRYIVVKKQLQELFKTSAFSWASVSVIKISASVILSGVPSDKFYVCMDAIRLDNVTTTSPGYGLVGYSAIKTTTAETIIKKSNSSNFVEFRFGLGVS